LVSVNSQINLMILFMHKM